MDMKRLEISRLMDEYTDTDFFPTGGSVADPEAVKGRVLANVKVPAKKTRKPAKKRLLIAAALAAMLVVLVGAGFPYIEHQLANGALIFQQAADGGRITGIVHYGPVIKLEDHRLFFFPQEDGQPIDITDLISEETPYIYDGSDPDAGLTYHIILGGAPECYGYFEWMTSLDPFNYGSNPAPAADENGVRLTTNYSFKLVTCEQGEWHDFVLAEFDRDSILWDDALDHPWLLNAIDELNIPIEYFPPETNNSYILQ